MSTVYLQKREARIIQVVKITQKDIYIASLKVATHSDAQITDEILEYIPKEKALEFLVTLNKLPVEPGHDAKMIQTEFMENSFVQCDYYPYAQIEAHYIETPDNLN